MVPVMKSLRLLFAWLALGVVAFAADGGAWMSDLDAAKAKAAAEKKPLIIDFTGSAWCPPCKALNKTVFASPEFAQFSKNVVLLALDFPPASERNTPEKIKANASLAKLMALKDQYGVTGFPTVFYFDPSGKEVSKIVGYDSETPAEYLAKLTGKTK